MTVSFWIIWLIAAAALIVIELLSGLIATFCVAIGCIVASIFDLVGLPVTAQLGGLAVGVILSFIFIAPFMNRLKKRRNKHRNDYNSNMEALIGREAVIEHQAENGRPARVRIDGDSWQIRPSDENLPLQHGQRVKVISYDSIILIVKPI